jgi:lipoprotein-releasing system permease protein
LGSNLTGLTVPSALSRRLRVGLGEKIKLISPVHVNSLLGEVPRSVSEIVKDVIVTNVPEIDILHIWTRISLIQNLIRKKEINRIRIYDEIDVESLEKDLLVLSGGEIFLRTWEDQNETLVFALKLESVAMIFLFVAMTMLVSICITSALMIFFDKIRADLTSFWILGMSKKQINSSTFVLLNLLGLATVVFGLICGGLTLFFIDKFGIDIMPAVFVDRKIPIHITPLGVFISFIVPYLISIIFSYFSLSSFKNDISYLDHVRSVGV